MELIENKEYEIYVTKYALTKGILKIKCRYSGRSDMMEDLRENHYIYYHGRGKDWHLNLKEAIRRAEQMKNKKISLLKKQIHKLGNKKF